MPEPCDAGRVGQTTLPITINTARTGIVSPIHASAGEIPRVPAVRSRVRRHAGALGVATEAGELWTDAVFGIGALGLGAASRDSSDRYALSEE